MKTITRTLFFLFAGLIFARPETLRAFSVPPSFPSCPSGCDCNVDDSYRPGSWYTVVVYCEYATAAEICDDVSESCNYYCNFALPWSVEEWYYMTYSWSVSADCSVDDVDGCFDPSQDPPADVSCNCGCLISPSKPQ